MSQEQRVSLQGGLQVDSSTIQQAYLHASHLNRTHDMLAETFRFLQMSKLHEANPHDPSTHEMMASIVRSQFMPSHSPEARERLAELDKPHPLNKLGNFSRELERKCRLTEQGLAEFEGSNPAKIKPIKSFRNRVEHHADRDRDDQIGWIEQHKKYPYRIVVVGPSDGHKGIYFADPEVAEQARLYFTQNYPRPREVGGLMSRLAQNYAHSSMEAFRGKLVGRQKLISKSMRFSRKVVGESQAGGEGNKSHNNNSIFYNEVLNMSSNHDARGSYRPPQQANPANSDNLRGSQAPHASRATQLAAAMQRHYLSRFAEEWARKGKSAGSNQRNTLEHLLGSGQARGSVRPTTSSYENRSVLRTSRKQESLFNYNRPEGAMSHRDDRPEESVLRGLNASTIREKESYREKDSLEIGPEYGREELKFYTIEFPTLDSLFFKPIVRVELSRKGKVEQSCVFNTVIKRKEPQLTYHMLPPTQDTALALSGPLSSYSIQLKVIDFLSNEETLSDTLSLANTKVAQRTLLPAEQQTMRVEVGLAQHEAAPSQSRAVPNLNVPPLPAQVVEKITTFGEREWESQGYYSEGRQSVYRLLGQMEGAPQSWWRGVEQQEYQVLHILHQASKLIGFRMVRSFRHLIQAFEQLFPDLEEMIQKLLSLVLTLLRPYYFPEHFHKLQPVHRLLGLEQDCELISKVGLETMVMGKLVELESPLLSDKISRRNIAYGYQLVEYVYEGFSRNFPLPCLVELWNCLLAQPALAQLYMLLLPVALMKHYEEDLIKAKRLSDLRRVLESRAVGRAEHLWKQVQALRDKYFGESRGLLEQIKSMFSSKPLEPVLTEFYRRESSRMDRRRVTQSLQKKAVMRKVNQQIEIELPDYPRNSYTLHLLFTGVPAPGTLTLKCGQVEYECLNHHQNRYFIVGEVSSPVSLHFLDLKSTEYSGRLLLGQGINQFSVTLSSPRAPQAHTVTYIAGLLTDAQLDMFKRGKKMDHFLGPMVRLNDWLEELNRPVEQALFLRKYDRGGSGDDIVRRIKNLFCSGTKAFNEIDFYLEQIQSSSLSIEEKVELTQELGRRMSEQHCLSHNPVFQKHLLKLLLDKTGFELTDSQFECYYNDSLPFEFDAPKVVKCRFHPLTPHQHQPARQVKLELEAIRHLNNRTARHVYPDLPVDDLLHDLKLNIAQQLGSNAEGELRLLYSSNGEVHLRAWQLRGVGKGRSTEWEEVGREASEDPLEESEWGEPQVLMTEVLPTFAKISTILDYVNNQRSPDLSKHQQRDSKGVPESMDVLRESAGRLRRVLGLRHSEHPAQPHFPFFHYYYELLNEPSSPAVRTVFLNNIKTDIKAVCTFKGSLKMGDSPKLENFNYHEHLGLYGNLRQLPADCKTWYFFGYLHDDPQPAEQARVFVNYGYGVFRWEQCQVLGYVTRRKPAKSKHEAPSSKREFLVTVRGSKKYVKEYELEMEAGVMQRLGELQDHQGHGDNANRTPRQQRSYFDQEDRGSLKYLSKFIQQ